MTDPLPVGVIGVGSMGRNHARVYRELPSASLVGVADADAERAADVAETYDTRAVETDTLLDAVAAVSIAVPTRYHYATAREAIERGVDVLVEKPLVQRPERGRELIDLARDRDTVLQVGHIERFNPAVRALESVVADREVIALDARRLGPPVDRHIEVDPVLDLMIHDLDVFRTIVGSDVARAEAARADGDPYVTATLEFEDGTVGTLTASRITQQKVRRLAITARDCQVNVDYIDQSVDVHRRSLPEYVEENGDVRFRNQEIVERPTVENGEPLKAELASFVEAAEGSGDPVVSGEDGLAALRLARRIVEAADEGRTPMPEVEP